jgi:hypothetical protein
LYVHHIVPKNDTSHAHHIWGIIKIKLTAPKSNNNHAAGQLLTSSETRYAHIYTFTS